MCKHCLTHQALIEDAVKDIATACGGEATPENTRVIAGRIERFLRERRQVNLRAATQFRQHQAGMIAKGPPS